MQRTASKLIGYSIGAIDGDIGSVDDVLFDDKLWTVRYSSPIRPNGSQAGAS
jgi:hypothetical protein